MSRAEASHACILRPDGQPAGGGVLISRTHVVTCAHVAALAWGEDIAHANKKVSTISLEFPFRKQSTTGHVRHFAPYVPGIGGESDLAIIELAAPLPEWAALAESIAEGVGARIHGHHKNGTTGSRIDGTVVCRLPDDRIQLGSGEREGSYFIREGASGCGAFVNDELIGITAIYDSEPGLREGFLIGSKLIRAALEPLLAESGRRLRLALGDDYEEARPDLAKAEFLCGTQQASGDGRLNAFLECGFDEPEGDAPRLRNVELRAMLPSGVEAVAITQSAIADEAPSVRIVERGKSDPRRPIWLISADEGETLCDRKIRCSRPAFTIEDAQPGQKIGAELLVYPNKGCVDDEDPDTRTLSAAKKKLIKRLKLRQSLGETRDDGAIVLCRATRIVEEVPK